MGNTRARQISASGQPILVPREGLVVASSPAGDRSNKLRPALYNTLAMEVAGKAVYMSFVLPATAVLALWLHPALAVGAGQLAAFLPALLLAWLLRFFWGYWLALLAFWTRRADALLALQGSPTFLLSGHVAPVALLPGGLRVAAGCLWQLQRSRKSPTGQTSR